MASPTWIRTSDRLPHNNQECILIPRGDISVHGPIMWKANGDGGVWIDLFATPEAGKMIHPRQVAYWCDAAEVLPEDLKEIPWEQTTDPDDHDRG